MSAGRPPVEWLTPDVDDRLDRAPDLLRRVLWLCSAVLDGRPVMAVWQLWLLHRERRR